MLDVDLFSEKSVRAELDKISASGDAAEKRWNVACPVIVDEGGGAVVVEADVAWKRVAVYEACAVQLRDGMGRLCEDAWQSLK